MNEYWISVEDGQEPGTNVSVKDIAQWMKENKCMDYVIIDDPESGACLCDKYEMDKLGFDLDRIVIVDPEVGLTMQDVNQIKKEWDTV